VSALAPYIPRKEADLNNWLASFSTLVSANPQLYALTANDAATIAQLTAQWTAAYQPVTSPASNTAQAVQAKNEATARVLPQIRTYAQFIANCPGVSAGNKLGLKLNPRTSPPGPITAPNSFPALLFQQATPLAAVLRYRDSVEVSGKAKPYGVIQCRVFGAVSAAPLTDQSALPLFATPTKSPFMLSFTGDQAGQTFYAAARWATRTGLVGPWSPMIHFTVVAA
jgi:hypothetical protein